MPDSIPGQAEACRTQDLRIDALQAELRAEVGELRARIGEEPSQIDGTPGTGLTKLVVQAIAEIRELKASVTKASSIPPPARPQQSIAQRLAWWLVVVVLAVQQIPTVYAAIKGAPSAPITKVNP